MCMIEEPVCFEGRSLRFNGIIQKYKPSFEPQKWHCIGLKTLENDYLCKALGIQYSLGGTLKLRKIQGGSVYYYGHRAFRCLHRVQKSHAKEMSVGSPVGEALKCADYTNLIQSTPVWSTLRIQ